MESSTPRQDHGRSEQHSGVLHGACQHLFSWEKIQARRRRLWWAQAARWCV
ncbi:MAG: hypothetical protein AAFX99_12055 [Myxococcota bacterium]